jgi:hypothetical protein
MTMVIECEACRSRFRLDMGLFKGSRAIRVRCRKCGGPIIALNPDFKEPPPVATETPAKPSRRKGAAPPSRSPTKETPATFPLFADASPAAAPAQEPTRKGPPPPEETEGHDSTPLPEESPVWADIPTQAPLPETAADAEGPKAAAAWDFGGEIQRERAAPDVEEPAASRLSLPAEEAPAGADVPERPSAPETAVAAEEPHAAAASNGGEDTQGESVASAVREMCDRESFVETVPQEPAAPAAEAAQAESAAPVAEEQAERAGAFAEAMQQELQALFVETAAEDAPPSFAEEPPLPFDLSGEVHPEPSSPPPAEPASADDLPAESEPFSPALEDLLSPHETEELLAAASPPGPAAAAPSGDGEAGDAPGRLSSLFEGDRERLDPAQPAGSEAVASALEDLFAPEPEEETEFDDDVPGDDDRAPFAPSLPPRKTAGERPPYTRPLFIVGVALWLLLLAGGALFFGTSKSGGRFGRSLLPSSGGGPGAATAARSNYEIRNVKWDSVRKTDAGDLFVVRGTVVNAGRRESAGIRIQATLMGTDNQALGERDVFAGNTIDDTALRHAPPAVLRAALNKRSGDGDRNRGIPPGGSLPFMVIFFDPPANISSILVKGVDAP